VLSVTDGTLTLDQDLLTAARITHRTRAIVQEGAITILPDEDVIEDTFGWIKLPKAAARYIADSKDLEYDI